MKQRAVRAVRRNPTRYDLVDRIEELIADYNAGSLNIDEYLRRLISLSHDLSTEERRAVVEDMTEEELPSRPSHQAGAGPRRDAENLSG